jgi:thymidine kinase
MEGRIELIIGPMFSGKTSELIRRIHRCHFAEQKFICIKYMSDKRYSESLISTHPTKINELKNSQVKAIPTTNLFDVTNLDKYDVIGIDEGQFFSDIVEFAEKMADSGKRVIISALDGTFERKPFGKINELIPKCDTVDKLQAICMTKGCRNDAPFTKRIIDSDEVNIIGGSDIYMSVCRKCYKQFL